MGCHQRVSYSIMRTLFDTGTLFMYEDLREELCYLQESLYLTTDCIRSWLIIYGIVCIGRSERKHYFL